MHTTRNRAVSGGPPYPGGHERASPVGRPWPAPVATLEQPTPPPRTRTVPAAGGRGDPHRRRTQPDQRQEGQCSMSQTATATPPTGRRLVDAKEVGRLLGCSWRTVLR